MNALNCTKYKRTLLHLHEVESLYKQLLQEARDNLDLALPYSTKLRKIEVSKEIFDKSDHNYDRDMTNTCGEFESCEHCETRSHYA